MVDLERLISERVHPAAEDLIDEDKSGAIRCLACGHRCVIRPWRHGVCYVRYNRDGTLYVPWGYVAGLQDDPIEKKPFFHALPGARCLSFGMLGCDLKCPYCQNWVTSQTLRDPHALSPPYDITPDEIVSHAIRRRCEVLTSTYNEPLITSEWAVEIFKHGKEAGLVTSYVSNGNGTPEVLEYIRPWTDLYKIDFKAITQDAYRQLGGSVRRVMDTIRMTVEMGFHVEVVTLVVPGLNDKEDDLRRMAEFLALVSPDLPWHLTAFHPDYKMTDHDWTPCEVLMRGHDIGVEAGLKYVYCGNRPGQVKETENTFCPDCKSMVIKRHHFTVIENRMENGACPDCGTKIPGYWRCGSTVGT